AVLKFAAAIGATPIAGCFIPGTFTNHSQAAFWEPCLLVDTDPEPSHVNLPTTALCKPASLHHGGIILCSNKGAHSGLTWWRLAWEVLHVAPSPGKYPWEVLSALYFYRDTEEIEKEEQAAAEKAVPKEEFQGDWTAPAPERTATQPVVAGWSELQVPSEPRQRVPTEDRSSTPSATEDRAVSPLVWAAVWVGQLLECR
uniref:Small ribosomal subunit protein uS2 C-terminal domain-containing protein n=1 Tax=Otolemur garnettii TaxID=30611 RepID=H0XI63_OTOGA